MFKGRVFIETGRLLIRQWEEKDLLPFFKLSTCPEVMKFFPKLLTREEVKQFVQKSSSSVEENGYSFWAVELKENSEFIGLIGLNKVWDLKISKEVLLKIAIQLGSDVPFFIYGKTAIAEGRGEILTEYPYKERFFLLHFPELKVSTKYAFEEGEIIFANKQGKSRSNFNSFEKWIKQNYLEMGKIFERLRDIGNPRLSGTGSTVFVEFDNLQKAISAQKKFPELVLTKSLERSPLMQIIE